MPKPRHFRLPSWMIACSPLERMMAYGGKRATDDSEQVTCKKCLEIVAQLVEQQLFPREPVWEPLFRKTDSKPPKSPSKFDYSLGARVRIT